ncbi:uncharacterized protein LOC144145708 isoform X2 [Haemaphysalis longicornis]
MPLHHRLVTVRRCWEVSIVVEEVYMESYELGHGGAANGLPSAEGVVVPDVVPRGPLLDHSAQKDKRLLAQQGSLGRRRKPSRGTLHAFFSALHRWGPDNGGSGTQDGQREHDRRNSAAAPPATPAKGSARPPATKHGVQPTAPHGGPTLPSTDINDNVNEADAKAKPHRTNQEPSLNNSNKSRNFKNESSKPSVRFTNVLRRQSEPSVGGKAGHLLDVPKKDALSGLALGHRRQSSLDSGCSLDMSSSSSSGKGSPDPLAPALTPPPEFADTPVMERRRRSRRRHTSSSGGPARSGSPGVGSYSNNAVPKVPDSIPRIPRAGGTSSAPKPASPEIQINFRILPRAKTRTADGQGPPVSRSESCRTYNMTVAPPVFKALSWDRRVELSSPSDRYLDDTERRCRSLSRTGRQSSTPQVGRDPEWLEIARRRQATGVDWENLETRMKQPHSISCSNLSESHMRGKVSSLAAADRAGLRLVRSASALYPRIKMSRYERRLRRDNPNPSPERRRSSDEFVLVSSASSSSSDGASAGGASSTEDEKPSFLNVQLRHVEKAPPLNVVFQTRGGGAGAGVGAELAAAAPVVAPARSASPTLTWKSHREDHQPHRLASASRDRTDGRTRAVSESRAVAEFLTPKRVELIESPPPAKTDGAPAHSRRSPTRTAFSDHGARAGPRAGAGAASALRRSSSVQMRSRDAVSTGRASPWDQTDSAATPSWVMEAERKKKSGIDWARLDKSLSQSGTKYLPANLSSECLHQPASSREAVPDWLKEIRKKKEEDAALRLSRSSDDLPCAVLLESLGVCGGGVADIDGGRLRAPSSRRDDSLGWPENLSALLDEIFSEAEESCTTPFPALPPSEPPPPLPDTDEGDDGDGCVSGDVIAGDRDDQEAGVGGDDLSKPSPAGEMAEETSESRGESVTNAAVAAADSHSPKQALMEELKHVLQKRNSLELLREDILNEANLIDTATPRPPSRRSPTETSRKTPPATDKQAEPMTEAGDGPSIPPPPPMPPCDFWSKPKEVWFEQQSRKPETGRLVAPVCQRDSETQTQPTEPSIQITSPVQAFSPGSMLHAMAPFTTYAHPFVAPGGSQLLLLDDRGVPLQSGPLYAMPLYTGTKPSTAEQATQPPAGVFQGTTAILVARDDDRIPKKVAMESKATSTDDHVTFSPTSARPPSATAEETKSLLDEVEKKLREDRTPPEETRSRTATPAPGVSKITVETTTITETLESTTLSRRAFDETSLKSLCARSEKEDVMSGLSESPIPFADDDDDILEEMGYSSHLESRSASRAGERGDIVSDDKLTMYTSMSKKSAPRAEPEQSTEVHVVKSVPVSHQGHPADPQPPKVSPPPVPSPPRAETPPRSVIKSPPVNGHRSPTPEVSVDVLDKGFHTERPKKKGSTGVTVLSSSKGDSVTSKYQRPSSISPSASSTVTTGPGGTLRGAHPRIVAQTLSGTPKEYCNGDVRSPLGPYRKVKSMSDTNLGEAAARARAPLKKATASQATQTPNGVIPSTEERRPSYGRFGGRAMGVQTDDRIESFLRDTVRTSTKEVEFITKVDSSQPSKTLRKKVTTKILRGTTGKNGGVREVIEEIYDQSSVVVRPSSAIKNVTRSVRQTSDGQKYLTTVITETPASGRSRRGRNRRGFGDPDTHIIMV